MRLPSYCWGSLSDWPIRAIACLTAGCVIAFTGLVEVLQFLAPGRHARMEDFVVDALAASLGLAAAASLDWTIRRTQRSLP